MGTRGPVPKPEATRRRRNKPAIPVKKASAGIKPVPTKTKAISPKVKAPLKKVAPKRSSKAQVAEPTPQVIVPVPIEKWHPIAKNWYVSLAESGQSAFYESSDWATAFLIAESISRDLSPQVVGVTPGGKIMRDVIPMKGASLSAYLKAMGDLLVTEGSRRRASVELQRGSQVDPDADRARATVTDIRSRLASG
jgi:hypothetical protein